MNTDNTEEGRELARRLIAKWDKVHIGQPTTNIILESKIVLTDMEIGVIVSRMSKEELAAYTNVMTDIAASQVTGDVPVGDVWARVLSSNFDRTEALRRIGKL